MPMSCLHVMMERDEEGRGGEAIIFWSKPWEFLSGLGTERRMLTQEYRLGLEWKIGNKRTGLGKWQREPHINCPQSSSTKRK